jgi:hypothetical protein
LRKKVFFVFVTGIIMCFLQSAGALQVGTTFSYVQCRYFDQDWKEVYIKTLDTGFDILRIGAYWSDIEKVEGEYDFTALDWQIEAAEKRNIPLVLTVGMKAPRWPEYFIPDWMMERLSVKHGGDVSGDAFLREKVLAFIQCVVERYRGKALIRYWQVENEPLDHMGEKRWYIGKDFLKQEVELVRRLDEGKRPIILTAATYPNKFLRFLSNFTTRHDPLEECLKLCDILGLNIYPTVGHKMWGGNGYFYSKPGEREKYFSSLVKEIKERGKVPWITELQAEPWEPGHLVYKPEERPRTISPERAEENFLEFKDMGFDCILLWGVEYWLYRIEEYGDTEWQDVITLVLKEGSGK